MLETTVPPLPPPCTSLCSKILGAAGDTEGPSNPIWLAPEIALNDAEATAASDVYSFGMVLYELLTWKLPWEGYNAFQVWCEALWRVEHLM